MDVADDNYNVLIHYDDEKMLKEIHSIVCNDSVMDL